MAVPVAAAPSLLSQIPVGQIASGVGGFLSGSKDRKFKSGARKRLGELDEEISRGVTDADLASITPLLMKAIQPTIQSAFSRGAGKFGSGSAHGAGAAIGQVAQAAAPTVGRAATEKIFGNFRAKQSQFRTFASLAA